VPVTLEPGASEKVKVPITINGIGAHNYTLTSPGLCRCHAPHTGRKISDPGRRWCFIQRARIITSLAMVMATRDRCSCHLSPSQRAGLRSCLSWAIRRVTRCKRRPWMRPKGETVGLNIARPGPGDWNVRITARLIDQGGKEISGRARKSAFARMKNRGGDRS